MGDIASGFNFVDITIIVIFLLSILLGLARGLISEILSILVLLAAFIVAIMFTDSLAAYFSGTDAVQHAVTQTTTVAGTDTKTPASYMVYGVSFLIIFLGTLLIGTIIKFFINLMLRSIVIGGGNRFLGGVFGIIRGYLINLFLIFVVQLSALTTQPWWQASKLVPFFQPQVVWLATLVSPMLQNIKAPAVEKTETNIINTD